MKCVMCKVRGATPDSEVCEEMGCIRKYLESGRGSISGNPYKQFMKHCAEVVREQECEADDGEKGK